MIKHNAGAEEVGHALCADEIFSKPSIPAYYK